MANSEWRVLLLEDNAVNALLVRNMLERSETPSFQVSHADSLVRALGLLASGRFDAALVDLNLPDSAGIETFLAVQRNAPGVPIVILSGTDDEALSVKAVELGAQDYLAKVGLSAPDLVRALQYAIIRGRKSADEGRPQQSAGSVLAFAGSKGGVGVTTLACHTARELERQTGESVLLAGIDRHSAGVAYLMKSGSQYTLSDAAENLHRLDSDLWKAFVHSVDGVDVLPPPGAALMPGPVEAERVRHVLRFARGIYPRVVLDLGVLDGPALGMLEDTTLVIVASEDLPALWEAGRLMKRLAQLGLTTASIRFVLNQRKRRGGVPIADLERALGHPVDATVMAAPEEQEDFLAEGRFVDEKAPIRKDIVKFVAKLLGKNVPDQGSGSRLSRFVRGE